MTLEKPRRYNYGNRTDYKHELGKWRRNWMKKTWRKLHLKKKIAA